MELLSCAWTPRLLFDSLPVMPPPPPPLPPPLLLLLLLLYPKDLCVLSRGEQGQWIKRTSVSATLGLELVEQVRGLDRASLLSRWRVFFDAMPCSRRGCCATAVPLLRRVYFKPHQQTTAVLLISRPDRRGATF